MTSLLLAFISVLSLWAPQQGTGNKFQPQELKELSLCWHNVNTSLVSSVTVVSNSYDYWKSIALTRWIFVGKVMSLLFTMLSRLVIAFVPRSKHLLISWLQSPSSVILEPKKIKVCLCFHCFHISLP